MIIILATYFSHEVTVENNPNANTQALGSDDLQIFGSLQKLTGEKLIPIFWHRIYPSSPSGPTGLLNQAPSNKNQMLEHFSLFFLKKKNLKHIGYKIRYLFV